uniref:Uncharacterized protein n=1 Tax=Oryza sativa subsp. japonica TaxID=39947 RepID=Q6YUM7_ORYSJ|nr:hypothetical protein [Oryza sativa Japonica Group]
MYHSTQRTGGPTGGKGRSDQQVTCGQTGGGDRERQAISAVRPEFDLGQTDVHQALA